MEWVICIARPNFRINGLILAKFGINMVSWIVHPCFILVCKFALHNLSPVLQDIVNGILQMMIQLKYMIQRIENV